MFRLPLCSCSQSSSLSVSRLSPLYSTSSLSLPLSALLLFSVRSKSDIVQKRAKRGLFAGKHIRFGNQVSHSHRKSRRSWSPNIHKKYYTSDLLQEKFHINVTTHAMKCIDKAGGLDNYILNTNKRLLGEGFALELRERLEHVYRPIKNKLEMEERWKRKKAKMMEQEQSQQQSAQADKAALPAAAVADAATLTLAALQNAAEPH